jgi:hypothetical protein
MIGLAIGGGLLAAALLAGGTAATRRGRRLRGGGRAVLVILGILLLLAAIPVGAVAGYAAWAVLRPQPEPARMRLFRGIEYLREVRQHPRPVVAHVVKVDLTEPGIRMFVTPPQRPAPRALRAQTTSEFLRTHGLQVAINANHFRPFWSNAPWDYYPHAGDPVDVVGWAVGGGMAYGRPWVEEATLWFSADGSAGIGAPPAEMRVEHAVAGSHRLLSGGEIAGDLEPGLYPRTAAGLSADGRWLILAVVDGKQPGYSEGMTLVELAELLRLHGAADAINLDGGGSSTLVISDGGATRVLNSPVNLRIIGSERVVANHLGIFAEP